MTRASSAVIDIFIILSWSSDTEGSRGTACVSTSASALCLICLISWWYCCLMTSSWRRYSYTHTHTAFQSWRHIPPPVVTCGPDTEQLVCVSPVVPPASCPEVCVGAQVVPPPAPDLQASLCAQPYTGADPDSQRGKVKGQREAVVLCLPRQPVWQGIYSSFEVTVLWVFPCNTTLYFYSILLSELTKFFSCRGCAQHYWGLQVCVMFLWSNLQWKPCCYKHSNLQLQTVFIRRLLF